MTFWVIFCGMEFRLANLEDLPQILDMYAEIINNMNISGVPIWNDIYPCAFFAEDIENRQLYVLAENGEIIAVTALISSKSGENSIEWQNPNAKPSYIARLGVSVQHRRKGIASHLIQKAAETAKNQGSQYLRLLAAEINGPAIALYTAQGFQKARGIHKEPYNGGILREYGYELPLD